MTRLIQCVPLMVLIFIPSLCQALWQEFELNSIDNYNLTIESPVRSNFTVVRINRRNFGVSGTLITKDIKNLSTDIKGYFKALPNDAYKPTVYKLNRIGACDFVNKYYTQFLMKDLREPVSNYPQFEDTNKDNCDELANKNFTLRKFIFDTSKIPSFMQSGQYKMVYAVYDSDDVVVSGADYYFRLF